MKRVIWLRDLSDMPDIQNDRFPPKLLREARHVLAGRGLRYDNATGSLYDNRWGLVSRFSNPSDHTPHETYVDVMLWEFSRYICNGASRLQRGYPV